MLSRRKLKKKIWAFLTSKSFVWRCGRIYLHGLFLCSEPRPNVRVVLMNFGPQYFIYVLSHPVSFMRCNAEGMRLALLQWAFCGCTVEAYRNFFYFFGCWNFEAEDQDQFTCTVIADWRRSKRSTLLIIKPMGCTISQIYFWNRTLHVSDSFSVHHQESSTTC